MIKEAVWVGLSLSLVGGALEVVRKLVVSCIWIRQSMYVKSGSLTVSRHLTEEDSI
jgi:hypothetical protein